MKRMVLLAVLLLTGCSRAGNPGDTAPATSDPAAPTVAPSPSAIAERPLPAGVGVTGLELGCGNRCPDFRAAVQAELEREMPGYPVISAMRLYRQSIVSVADPHVMCDHTVDLLVAIVEAPGRSDAPVAVFYDGTATVRAVPWVRC
jgi:hypothetical protein